ncbi:PhzF family phenazine biosynthesis protein [Paenibacillus alkalitolerans]|uniref:PhzF family phenazine biosynthesis protein n=1 Tax=Paenibacillus alkalitolerans TaxID=2799335 RepID=UPI0018F75A8A|nr:PhzF family phenazine biosynthesis protein [Paenibacillus alkalitolerans]
MSGTTFYIVDVFAERKYAGNQLAVVLDGQRFTTEEMQRIAKEMNYSETTFVMSEEPADGAFPVRIFTPEEELPFAGHPTLGTAYIIQKEILRQRVSTVTLQLGVGPITVSFTYNGDEPDKLSMRQNEPSFGPVYDHRLFAEMLSLEIDDVDQLLPVETVSTGVPAVVIPINSLPALKTCKVNAELYWKFTENSMAKMLLAFCREPQEEGNDLHMRVFVDYFGIPEDPATGSAAGDLTGYLLKHGLYGDAFRLRAEQGYSIGRPSILELGGTKEVNRFRIDVGGRCFLVAKGELL